MVIAGRWNEHTFHKLSPNWPSQKNVLCPAQLPIPIIAYLVLPVSEIPEATKSMEIRWVRPGSVTFSAGTRQRSWAERCQASPQKASQLASDRESQHVAAKPCWSMGWSSSPTRFVNVCSPFPKVSKLFETLVCQKKCHSLFANWFQNSQTEAVGTWNRRGLRGWRLVQTSPVQSTS